MPLYDLVCECGHMEEDVKLTVAEYEKATCSECGGKLKSKPHSMMFRLKGYGWTPRMSGPERFRPREQVIAEAKHTYKEAHAVKELAKERARKIYVT